MQIGTPLSPSALRVMLLGAGELGKEVLIALQRLGVETIAVDRYPDAPGMQVAHRAHVMAMTDGAALRALVEQEKPQLIVPEIEAIATDMLLEIERDGLYVLNPGSVGQPRDGDARAAWAIYDTEERIAVFRRVCYDIKSCQDKILKAGLPEPLAFRLEVGS